MSNRLFTEKEALEAFQLVLSMPDTNTQEWKDKLLIANIMLLVNSIQEGEITANQTVNILTSMIRFIRNEAHKI